MAGSVASMLKTVIILSIYVCDLYIKNQNVMENLKLKYFLSIKMMLFKKLNGFL